MSLFLTAEEKGAFTAIRRTTPVGRDLFSALHQRATERAASPGLHGSGEESRWWYCAAEYLSDAAMLHALEPSATVGTWLRDASISLVRRSEDDWIGPSFRDHITTPARGNLETAHLSWSIAVVLDLAPDVFAESELQEIRQVLQYRAIPMCRRWLEAHNHMANWRCVLGAGIAVAAAVLHDEAEMERSVTDYRLHIQAFQPDGSYGESLQYANYAACHLMIAREALLRRNPGLEKELPPEPWALLPRWQAASLFYRKALSGWGASPRARSANFNDSAALFRPSADLLLHISARCQRSLPTEAGLARWLFDTLYAPDLAQGPHDCASFGFLNDFGFLSVPLLPQACGPQSPAQAALPRLSTFSCGDVFARDSWDAETILAVHGGGDPLRGPGHLHGDLNSFILVHKKERLLVDPGHSCYRNLIHGLEGSTRTHNTCTFLLSPEDELGLQEDKDKQRRLEQSRSARVFFSPETGVLGAPVNRGAKRLIVDQQGDVCVVGSDAAALYGQPIRQFSRFWILCGKHVLFIVDRIVADEPVRACWHWLLNNRDGGLQLEIAPPDRIVARRGRAGFKLFHLGEGEISEPENAYVHDAYHPTPACKGEGLPGSGKLLTWSEGKGIKERTAIHAIAMDGYGSIGDWNLRAVDGGNALDGPEGTSWLICISPDARQIGITDAATGRTWNVSMRDRWLLQAEG